MHCRDIEPLLLAEPDGGLSTAEQAALAQHVAGCAGCRQMQAGLRAARAAYRADAAQIAVPDADEQWRLLQVRIRAEQQRARGAGTVPSWIKWFGTPLAAAAALTVAFYAGRATALRPAGEFAEPEVAWADFVEVADTGATPIVFRDEESGWLVVWAEDGEAATHS